jgi:hypothetical protein
MSEHMPVVVHDAADPERVAPPSEICVTCSDIEGGRLVPASFCEQARGQLGPAPWEG